MLGFASTTRQAQVTSHGSVTDDESCVRPDVEAGACMISIKDVARHAGVSVGTVSNVINRPSMVSADVRARVSKVIEELGYVRSESARQLRAGRSRIMALLVLDM